jgi:hypothetical protein
VWLALPHAGELGEAAIGADEEHPTRLVRYDLAQRTRSVEVDALTTTRSGPTATGLPTGPRSRWRSSRRAWTRLSASIWTGSE